MLKRATARSNSKKSTNNAIPNVAATTTTSSSSSSLSSSLVPSSPSVTPLLLFHQDDHHPGVVVKNNNNDNLNKDKNDNEEDDEIIIERIRLKIPNAHVFKLPPKPTSGGWRGGEWTDKIWQGTLKIVERGRDTAVLLVDAKEERNIFAVCPIRHSIPPSSSSSSISMDNHLANSSGGSSSSMSGSNGVDRCIDSSRYFVLRIQNAEGRHMYIGLAFNERNDAFDFNTSLEDSRREKEVEYQLLMREKMRKLGGSGGDNNDDGMVDYTMKEGEKIHVSIPSRNNNSKSSSTSKQEEEEETKKFTTTITSSASSWSSSTNNKKGKGARGSNSSRSAMLKPSTKDTPSKLA